jgi:hypothetical protein
MVVGILMLLKYLSLYWMFRSCSCFIYPYLLLCASLIYFLTRFLCIVSGLDLNVFYICSLMLFLASTHISYVSIFSNYWAELKGVKEKHSWEITHYFTFSSFSFIWVLEVITTVITTPYPFYFVVVPRETFNLSEIRFGDVTVLKQISVLHHKNSWKFLVYLFDLWFLVHMPQVISKLSSVLHFLIWAIENPQKMTFFSYSVLTDFCHYLCLPLDRFLFEFFWWRNFWGNCYSSICFICGGFELKYESKRGWFIIILTLMLLTELCWVLYEGSFQV